MRIERLRIQNFKSFEDSGWIEFSKGFNVIVGKNSSGKTALLESLRLNRTHHHPHLSLSRKREAPLAPQSNFEFKLSFAEGELKNALLRIGQIHFPIHSIGRTSVESGHQLINDFFEGRDQSLTLKIHPGGSAEAVDYPSHGLFALQQAQPINLAVSPSANRLSYTTSGPGGGNTDTIPKLVDDLLPRKLYVFKAERLNIGEIIFAEEKILAENAANLPRVLFALTTNPALFERYNRHVNEIFPYIKRVAVFPKGSNVEVRLWWVDPTTERDDLAIPLQESGTGVGQVLAILYVAMTMHQGIIVIDEPNSFLHPGASKKLIEILRQYDNQYIVSTHSPEIISVASPSTLLVAHWEEGTTKIERVEGSNVSKHKNILTEVGVSAADVFGADRLVWVEGLTEENCFPLILQKALGALPPGLDFLAVRSVDEIIRKQGTDAIVMEVYNKLSSASTILPEVVHFSFDREKRLPDYIEKVQAETKGKVKFLPARCYECFLLHTKAIQSLLEQEAVALGLPIPSLDDVEAWIKSEGPRYDTKVAWSGSIDDPWKYGVESPSLLRDIFWHFTKLEYSKTKHSRALTVWLLENDPDSLEELTQYVVDLTKPLPT